MTDSILTSVKHVLGLTEEYTAFDIDVIMHINSALATLFELGIGPETGFQIEDADATWTEFLGATPTLNSVKTYVYLRVRLLFDPPATSYHLSSMKEQIDELQWRLTAHHDKSFNN